MQHGEDTGCRQPEDRAEAEGTSSLCRAVQVTVGSLNERGGRISSPAAVCERVQRGHRPTRGHHEYCAKPEWAPFGRRSIQVAIRPLDETRGAGSDIRQPLQESTVPTGPERRSAQRSIQIAVGRFEQSRVRTKWLQDRECATRRHFEERAADR